MHKQIYLIVPAITEMESLYQMVERAFSLAKISALLLVRKTINEKDYSKLAKKIIPLAHIHNCAFLIDNNIGLVKQLGADGVHINNDINLLEKAIKQLKPELIVGFGNIDNRHDAMIGGELGADYIFFGEIEGNNDNNDKIKELVIWWEETTNVPAILNLTNQISHSKILQQLEFIAINSEIFHTKQTSNHFLSILNNMSASKNDKISS